MSKTKESPPHLSKLLRVDSEALKALDLPVGILLGRESRELYRSDLVRVTVEPILRSEFNLEDAS